MVDHLPRQTNTAASAPPPSAEALLATEADFERARQKERALQRKANLLTAGALLAASVLIAVGVAEVLNGSPTRSVFSLPVLLGGFLPLAVFIAFWVMQDLTRMDLRKHRKDWATENNVRCLSALSYCMAADGELREAVEKALNSGRQLTCREVAALLSYPQARRDHALREQFRLL